MRLPDLTAPQPELVFRKSETDRFIEGLGGTLHSLSETQLSALYGKVKAQNAISITYDAELRPSLICQPASEGQSDKVPIQGDTQILRRIGGSLLDQSDQLPGRQVILSNTRAFLPFESGELVFCEWMWLGDPLIESAIAILDVLLSDEN